MAKGEIVSLTTMLSTFADKIQVTSSFTYDPHPKQREFHCSSAKEKQFIGGNRSGKTVGSVLECIFRLTKSHPFRPELNSIPGPIRGRLVCVSFIEGLEAIILPLFKQWLPTQYLINGDWEDSYSAKFRRLTLKDGSFIEFMSYEQDTEKFAGTSRHFTAFDEEPPLIVWQECILRLLDTDGDWWIAMTPVEGATWTYRDLYKPYKKGLKPFLLVVEVNTLENPHINKDAYERTFANFNEEDKLARSEGAYNFDSSLIYPTFDREEHVLDNFKIPRNGDRDWFIYTSLDSGFRHPAAWLWHAVHVSGRIVTFHEIILAKQSVDMMAKRVLDYETANNITPHLRTGDPALLQTREHTGTSVAQEYALRGIHINVQGVPRGPGSVTNGINKVTQYLDRRVKVKTVEGIVSIPVYMVTKNCDKLIEEFENYRWAKRASRKLEYEQAPLDAPVKKDDDGMDSLRYLVTLMDDLAPDSLVKDRPAEFYLDGKRINNLPHAELAGRHHLESYENNFDNDGYVTIYENVNESWY